PDTVDLAQLGADDLPFPLGRVADPLLDRAARFLVDVTPGTALDGQRERGRGVSRYAFLRHRQAAGRLLRAAEKGKLPEGVGSAVLLDRDAADVLHRIAFARRTD
ncbi:hypothetical protein ABZ372_32310, partial [Streptomyces sp. NPDC005921]